MPYLFKQMFYFNVLFFLSCVNGNDKTYISNSHKFYIIENLNENDIVNKIEDKYDTSSMVFVKGGKFIFGNNNGLDRKN